MTSFKLKLVIYFLLLALVPLGIAFLGFGTALRRSETGRIDARLQAALRSSQSAYAHEVAAAAARAARIARDPRVQRALRARDRAALDRLARPTPGVEIVLGGGPLPAPAHLVVRRSVGVLEGKRVLGEVVVTLPLGEDLLGRIRARAALERTDDLLLLDGSRTVAGPPALVGSRLPAEPGLPEAVSAGGSRYRVLAGGPLPEPPGARFAVLTPQSLVEDANAEAGQRLVLGLVGALALSAIVAWLLGRSVVRPLRELARGADAIAGGRLGERVPVRGRDEFAELARSFNDMAAQLEAHLDELEAERRRLRETTLRFAEALGATHDTGQLRRVIVETAVEATGAGGGELLAGEERIAVGDPSGPDRIELPLRAGSKSLGTLVLAGESFGEEERALASLFAGQAVVALENARLHAVVERQATVDALTGLANRRRGDELLRVELARAERLGAPLALVLADLDHFKSVNDRHGHPAGDLVLREFASTVRENVREIDRAARWGGEEFAVLLPGTDREGARRLAERLRSALEGRIVLAPNGTRVQVTASFGVAAFPAEPTAERLVAAADAALYEAKRTGRNRVVEARTATLPSPTAS